MWINEKIFLPFEVNAVSTAELEAIVFGALPSEKPSEEAAEAKEENSTLKAAPWQVFQLLMNILINIPYLVLFITVPVINMTMKIINIVLLLLLRDSRRSTTSGQMAVAEKQGLQENIDEKSQDPPLAS